MDKNKKLYRSGDKWVAGVCGGLADFLDVNRDVVRLLWLIATVCTGLLPFGLAYILLWIFVPQEYMLP